MFSKYQISCFSVSALLFLALTVPAVEASASELLRVYTVKNVANEVNQLGRAFSDNNPQTPVIVTGGVPGKGFAEFVDGHFDVLICPQGQCESLKQSAGTHFRLNETAVGSYGMAIIVNPDLPVSTLSLADARKLFMGEYTNWSQVNGPNQPVTVYTRELNAGTTTYLKGRLLQGGDFAATSVHIAFDREILRHIAMSTGSVGYVRVNRIGANRVKTITLKEKADSPGIACSEENVRNQTYPLTVTLAAHWNGLSTKTAAILSFVNFCKQNQIGLK